MMKRRKEARRMQEKFNKKMILRMVWRMLHFMAIVIWLKAKRKLIDIIRSQRSKRMITLLGKVMR